MPRRLVPLPAGMTFAWTSSALQGGSTVTGNSVPPLKYNLSRCDQQALQGTLHLPAGSHSKGTKSRGNSQKSNGGPSHRELLLPVLGQDT